MKPSADNTGWIDISVTLRNGMVHWPTDPPVQISRVHDMESGDRNTLSQIAMSVHAGTHVDAPLHFIRQGVGIDKIPLDTVMGKARVIEIVDGESVKPGELDQHDIRRGERILFKTRNSARCWQTADFIEDYVFISIEAARILVERGIILVGVDYLSAGGFKSGNPETHRMFLENGIWIIEGLDLSRVVPGTYELICLPLKIEQGDGAPARALVRPV